MCFPYIHSEAENQLLDLYANSMKHAVIGFDGIPEPHLQALKEVDRMAAARGRSQALAEAGVMPDQQALLAVADAASVLLLFVEMALRNPKLPLRSDCKSVAAKLGELLAEAGYSGKSAFTGHRERPAAPISVSQYLD